MDLDLTEPQQDFKEMLHDFAEKEIAPQARELDDKAEFPYQIQKKMAELGLFGLPIPEEYGGSGADFVTYAIAVEQISRVSASLGITMAAHTSLGALPICLFGNEQQRQQWLIPLAQGSMLGAFGLTEPEAGSDAGSTKTTAVLQDGQWVINGTKCFITNSGTDITGIVIITAITGDHGGKKEISNIIVPGGAPGFIVSPSYQKMGWHSSDTHELSFSDCGVPEGNLLGGRGEGFKQFLKVLDCGRIGVAAMSVGIAQACLDASVDYARTRVQFGRPIGRNQAVSFKCADMLVDVELARDATWKAAWMADEGRDYSRQASIAKLFSSEAAMRAASNAVQIHGGYGYIEDYAVCRYFRDSKILEIGEGTSEVQRIVLSRGLGL